MSSTNEYDDSMVAMLELIWGEGFMAPGGEGNVHRIVDGLDLSGKTVLEIGSGIGGGALVLAGRHGANVIGCEIETDLVERARGYADKAGFGDKIGFRVVRPGALPVGDGSIDVVYSSGVFIHMEDKQAAFADVLRALKPGGVLTGYDWLKAPGPLSADMQRWIELEGLGFHMDTLDGYAAMLAAVGFQRVTTEDATSWYARRAQDEFRQMSGPLYQDMTRLLGEEKRDYFLADWEAMTLVLAKGELRSGYFRGFKPGP